MVSAAVTLYKTVTRFIRVSDVTVKYGIKSGF